MRQLRVFVVSMAIIGLGMPVSSSSTAAQEAAPAVTFNKDVLPILQTNCQVCHRPGEIAPMSFLTYEDVRPRAGAIKSAVISKQMPPWLADPRYGKFRNAPQLTEANIKTLGDWVDAGAPEGAASDQPAPRQWTDGWRIQPDVIVSMAQPFEIPAQGTEKIREFLIPNPFKEDTWVTSIEVRPGDPSVVRYVIVQVVDPDRDAAALRSQGFSDTAVRFYLGSPAALFTKLEELKTGLGAFAPMETVYARGTSPLDFRYTNAAKVIRGGGQIRIQVHYMPNGRATRDQTRIGFTLAKAPALRRFVLMAPEHLVDPRKPIPAGAANWETRGEITFMQDAELVWFMPQMHLRGKDMTLELAYPDGKRETVLSAKFNFNWQTCYELEEPLRIPKGTRLFVTAHHDNSAKNPLNPDSARDAVWGALTSQEMMLPWFGVIVDHAAPPRAIASYHPKNLVLDNDLKELDRLLLAPR